MQGTELSAVVQTHDQQGKSSLLLPLFFSLLMAAASVFCQRGGALSQEVEFRLPYYLSHAPLLQKIYDSNYLDGGMFQARELSYLFDYIDCKFIAWCVALGHPHFLSLTHYVFLLAISLALWRFGADDLKLSQAIVLGVLLLFWTTPAVFLGGAFFRTAKIGVALAVVVMYWLIFRILRDARENPNYQLPARTWFTCFGWAWTATLFDRQGVFMVGLAAFFVALWLVGTPRRGVRAVAWIAPHPGRLGEASLPQESSVPLSLTLSPLGGARESARSRLVVECGGFKSVPFKLLSAFAAALVLSFAYNHVIAPLLTMSMNDYWPDFHYQQLPLEKLIGRPRFYITSGVLFYIDTIRFFLGNIPRWAVATALVGLVALVSVKCFKRGQRKPFIVVALGLLVCQVELIWVMNALMVLRHEGLLWEDVRRTYYALPVLSMLAMTLLFALAQLNEAQLITKAPVSDPLAPPSGERARERGTHSLLWLPLRLPKAWPLILLAAAILGNIIALPAHDVILRGDHAKEAYESTPAVLDALRHLRSPNYAVPPELISNRVIQFFHDGTVPKTFQNPK